MLFFLTTISQAEPQTIWLDKTILILKPFQNRYDGDFLEQEQADALLFDIEDSDLTRLQEKGIPFQRHRESKDIPTAIVIHKMVSI